MLTHPGVYCLRSNETDFSEERLWRTFTLLTDVEAVFRSLKSELGLRPIHHRKPRRAEGHLFISVIDHENARTFRIACRLDARNFRMLQDIEQHLNIDSRRAPVRRGRQHHRKRPGRSLHTSSVRRRVAGAVEVGPEWVAGGNVVRIETGDSMYIPDGTARNDFATSDSVEPLEVGVPADMGTEPCDASDAKASPAGGTHALRPASTLGRWPHALCWTAPPECR